MVEDELPKVTTKATLSILDKLDRKISRKGVESAGKGFTLFISNKGMDEIIKNIKSLEDSDLFIDGTTEIVKYEIKKKQEGEFLGAMVAPMTASLIAPMASSMIKPAAS